MKQRLTSSSGFTIIELMIATAVFSVVLLLLVTGVITVTRQYIQGLNEAHTQDVARNISNTVSQAIQFNGGSYTGPGSPVVGTYGSENRICLGDDRYSYLLGEELEDQPSSSPQQTADALVEDSGSCSAGTTPLMFTSAPLPTGATELLSANMRLDNLSVSKVVGSLNTYNVCVRVVYGSDDSVTAFTRAGTNLCNQSGIQEHQCASGGLLDFAFCAVSEIDTTVKQRVPS
jgi:prepilin-type N-terminal cleavage/methylation domain-containing protein